MKPIQILLIALVAVLAVLYFARFRTRLLDRVIAVCFVGASVYLLIDPGFASWIAALVGVGRGVDVVIYFALLINGFFLLLLFSKIRELEQRNTELVRGLAIHAALTAPEAGEGHRAPGLRPPADLGY